MIQKSRIAILGGGGRTGSFVVTELLQQGYSLKVLIRKPEFFALQHPLMEIIKGDALESTAIRELLKDCTAVISTIGQRKDEPLVASTATRNVLQAMHEN